LHYILCKSCDICWRVYLYQIDCVSISDKKPVYVEIAVGPKKLCVVKHTVFSVGEKNWNEIVNFDFVS